MALFVEANEYEPSHEKTNNLGFRPGPTQTGKQARSLKFWISEEEELSYLCSEIKDADRLCSFCSAPLFLPTHVVVMSPQTKGQDIVFGVDPVGVDIRFA